VIGFSSCYLQEYAGLGTHINIGLEARNHRRRQGWEMNVTEQKYDREKVDVVLKIYREKGYPKVWVRAGGERAL